MCLPRRVYPGLIPGDGKARGKVFTDLTDTEWEILDAFEDPAYTLTPLRVMTFLETDALAYTWRGEHTDQLWVCTEFGHHDLADYLNRCRTWRRHYDATTSCETADPRATDRELSGSLDPGSPCHVALPASDTESPCCVAE